MFDYINYSLSYLNSTETLVTPRQLLAHMLQEYIRQCNSHFYNLFGTRHHKADAVFIKSYIEQPNTEIMKALNQLGEKEFNIDGELANLFKTFLMFYPHYQNQLSSKMTDALLPAHHSLCVVADALQMVDCIDKLSLHYCPANIKMAEAAIGMLGEVGHLLQDKQAIHIVPRLLDWVDDLHVGKSAGTALPKFARLMTKNDKHKLVKKILKNTKDLHFKYFASQLKTLKKLHHLILEQDKQKLVDRLLELIDFVNLMESITGFPNTRGLLLVLSEYSAFISDDWKSESTLELLRYLNTQAMSIEDRKRACILLGTLAPNIPHNLMLSVIQSILEFLVQIDSYSAVRATIQQIFQTNLIPDLAGQLISELIKFLTHERDHVKYAVILILGDIIKMIPVDMLPNVKEELQNLVLRQEEDFGIRKLAFINLIKHFDKYIKEEFVFSFMLQLTFSTNRRDIQAVELDAIYKKIVIVDPEDNTQNRPLLSRDVKSRYLTQIINCITQKQAMELPLKVEENSELLRRFAKELLGLLKDDVPNSKLQKQINAILAEKLPRSVSVGHLSHNFWVKTTPVSNNVDDLQQRFDNMKAALIDPANSQAKMDSMVDEMIAKRGKNSMYTEEKYQLLYPYFILAYHVFRTADKSNNYALMELFTEQSYLQKMNRFLPGDLSKIVLEYAEIKLAR